MKKRSAKPKPEAVVAARLPAGTAEMLEAYVKSNGLKKGELLARLVEFFVTAPPPLQRIIHQRGQMSEMKGAYADALVDYVKRLRGGGA